MITLDADQLREELEFVNPDGLADSEQMKT